MYIKKKKNDKIVQKNTKPTQHNLVYVQNWNSTKKIQKIKELDVLKKGNTKPMQCNLVYVQNSNSTKNYKR